MTEFNSEQYPYKFIKFQRVFFSAIKGFGCCGEAIFNT